MTDLGAIYGRDGRVKDRNPYLKGPNHRMDHIVKCPLCDTGMAFTDILYVRDSGGWWHWGCPHCNRYIHSVKPNIIKEVVE